MDNDSIIKAYDDILKGIGIGREVGTEKTAQRFWMEFLAPYGFKPQQAFPDNMTMGTNRNAGDASIGRTTTVLNHLFEPKWVTYTYYDLEHGIPLYTRTVGETSGDLIIRGGLIGMRDVAGNRTPTKNPLLTDIDRTRASQVIRASKMLENAGGTGNEHAMNTMKKPPKGWINNFKTADTQADYLENEYPEYHQYLVEYLHKPIEAKGILQDLKITKKNAQFVSLVEKLVREEYPDLVKEILSEATAMHPDKWHITVAANVRLKPGLMRTGFKPITSDYMNELLSDKSGAVSDYIKMALGQINTRAGRLTGKDSEYFIRTPRGESIKPISKSAWLNTLRGNNMFDKIRKAEITSWFDLLKFKGPFDDKEDERDKEGKDKMPAGGSSPPKKPRNKEDADTIRERGKGQDWSGDWKKELNVDPVTGKKRNASKLEEERETVSTDSLCCSKIRQNLKDYVELTSYKSDYQLRMVEEWIDENITCSDIEKAMAIRVITEDEDGNEITNTQPWMNPSFQATDGNWIKYRVRTDNTNKGFTIPLQFDEDSGEVSGSKTVRIPAHEVSFFDRVAGKLSFIPVQNWRKPPTGRVTRANAGAGYSLVMAYKACISGQVKNKKTEISGTFDNPEFYEDMGTTTDSQLKIVKDILDAFKQRGGKFGGSSNNQPDLKQMKADMPDLFVRWERASQISNTGEDSTGYRTEDEMNPNELARERLWDYIDEMSGKTTSLEERKKKRAANPLGRNKRHIKPEEDDEDGK